MTPDPNEDRKTRTQRCASELIGAQAAISEAISELYSRTPRDERTLRCVLDALEELGKAASFIQGQRGMKARARKAIV